MSPLRIKQILAALLIVIAGAGAVYAAFTSNTVSIQNSTLTTGQATVKLCDIGGSNSWSGSINPSLNVSAMAPNEERDMLLNREVHIGNDNGQLATVVGASKCTAYDGTPGGSVTPMKILPNVTFASETCPDSLPSNVKLRFDIKGVDTGYKTLNAWATNTTSYGPDIMPGEAGQIKGYAQLSSTTTTQQASCTFAVNFTGKQPS